jgi:drug/metabolite transporter (DMT)-like permease
MILIIILYMLCASMFTISKWALAYTQPIFLVGVRMAVAGVILWGYCLVRSYIKKEKIIFNPRKDWLLLAQIVFFHIYLTYICDLCALKNISSIESAFLYNLSPFISALFSYVWFAERMTLKKWIGLSIGFTSLLPELIKDVSHENFVSHITPKLIMIGAVVSSAYGWIVLRRLVKDKGYSPIFVNGFGMFFGGLLALVTSYYVEGWIPSPVTQWVPFIQSTILIIIVANIMFYNLYGFLLTQYTATFLSFAGFMCPFFAGILGWLFLNESLPPHLILSFVIVSIGLFIFYQEELRQGYILK